MLPALQESRERVPTNILSERLKRLEEWGLVIREPYQQQPVRYAYRLTDAGESLEPVLLQMRAWGHNELGGGRYDPATGKSLKPATRTKVDGIETQSASGSIEMADGTEDRKKRPRAAGRARPKRAFQAAEYALREPAQ